MVSTWHSKYIVDSLSEDFNEHLVNKADSPLISHYKVRNQFESKKVKLGPNFECINFRF